MFSTRSAPEWRDDIPRSFSSTELPPHIPVIRQRRRRVPTSILLPRLVALAVRR